MLNVTDQYCIAPPTSKGEFSCHPGDLSRKCHSCHVSGQESEAQGLLPCVTRQSGTLVPCSGLWRVCPHFCWDSVLVYLVFPALYTLI